MTAYTKKSRCPAIATQFRYEIRDKDGKLTKKSRWFKSKSYLEQFLRLLRTGCTSAGETTIDINGAQQTTSVTANFKLTEVSTASGVVIGTGTTGVALADRKLQTQVTTNWVYGTVSIAAAVTAADADYFEVTRTFTNNTGAAVTLNEIGVYALSGTNHFAIIRDIIAGGASVGDGASITFAYRMRIVS